MFTSAGRFQGVEQMLVRPLSGLYHEAVVSQHVSMPPNSFSQVNVSMEKGFTIFTRVFSFCGKAAQLGPGVFFFLLAAVQASFNRPSFIERYYHSII